MSVGLIVIVLCWAVFEGYWLVSALRTKRTVERSRRWWFIVIIVGLAAYVARPRVHDEVLWQHSVLTSILGDVLAVLGLSVALWARRAIGSNWSGAVTVKEGHELIQHGPYAHVRHPIYSGLLLLVFGSALFYGHLVGVWMSGLFVLIFYFKAREEEKMMTRHFPEEYARYKEHVKMLIPHVL